MYASDDAVRPKEGFYRVQCLAKDRIDFDSLPTVEGKTLNQSTATVPL
jgi:hypothetical protein